jgi:Domain of unknown function (DUF4234)
MGRHRSPLAVILWSILTLGIYLLYWIYITFAEVRARREQGVAPIVGLLLALIPVSIFLLPSYVGNMYAEDGREKPITGLTGLWALIPLIGGLVWLFRVQGALNHFWASVAEPSTATPEAPEAPVEPQA